MNHVPFGSTCSLQNGRAFKPEEWSNQGTPIVRIQNLNDESKPFNYCNFEVEDRFHVATGDLLFSWSGTPGTSFGAFFWNRGKGFLNQHIFRVDVYEDSVDKNYLRYAVNSKLDQIINEAHGGVGLKHITKGKLEAVEIPLPPLKEQQRIAAILDKADNLRRKRQQAIQLADQFLRAVFLDMFGDPVTNPKGWERRSLKSVCSRFSDGPFGSLLKSEHYVEEGVRVVRLQNIGVGQYKDKDKAFISRKYYESTLKKFSCRPGDIVIGTLGEPNVRACLLPEYIDVAINKADCIHCVPDENIVCRDYLVSLLNLPQFLHFFSGLLHGQTRTRVSSGQLSRVDIPIPTIEIQKRFSDISRAIAKNNSRIEISVSGINNIFSSLSQKAFAGQL